MILFLVCAAFLVVISCAIFVMPLISEKELLNTDQDLRDQLNKFFYKDRLQELEQEDEKGLISDKRQLIKDLKQSLLDDIPTENVKDQQMYLSKKLINLVAIGSLGFTLILTFGLYAKFGAYEQVLRWQNAVNNLPLLSQKLFVQNAQQLSPDEITNLTLALRTRLQTQDKDTDTWLLLGRLALEENNLTSAIAALKKAYSLSPNDPEVQLSYSQALMISQNEQDQKLAHTILEQLSKQEKLDVRTLSLLAFDAFAREDFASAAKYWTMMKQLLPKDDLRHEILSRSIENALGQIKQ